MSSTEAAVRLGAPHCAYCREVDFQEIAAVSGFKSIKEIDGAKPSRDVGHKETFCSVRCALNALRDHYYTGTAIALVHDPVHGNVLVLKSEASTVPRLTDRARKMMLGP